jgi:hypothetical protein
MKSYLRLTIDLAAGADFNGNPAIRSNTVGDDAWDIGRATRAGRSQLVTIVFPTSGHVGLGRIARVESVAEDQVLAEIRTRPGSATRRDPTPDEATTIEALSKALERASKRLDAIADGAAEAEMPGLEENARQWAAETRSAIAHVESVRGDQVLAEANATCSSTVRRNPTPDEVVGMAWWNGLSEAERAKWLAAAGSAVVADAWAAFKAARSREDEK